MNLLNGYWKNVGGWLKMKDKDDIMVKNLIPLLESCPDNDPQTTAINIMYHIRGNKDLYFRILDKES